MTAEDLPAEECLDWRDDGSCSGRVGYHSTDPGRRPAFPRCEAHWGERLDEEERISRRYGGDLPPADFDPGYAGETW